MEKVTFINGEPLGRDHLKRYGEALVVTDEPADRDKGAGVVAYLGPVHDYAGKRLKMCCPRILVVIKGGRDNDTYEVLEEWEQTGRVDLEVPFQFRSIREVLVDLKTLDREL